MASILFIVLANAAIFAPPVETPVREWSQPGLEIRVAPSALLVRGHVASTTHAGRLLAGTNDQIQTEFWRHVALPADWQNLSIELLTIARQLQSGRATLSRDDISLTGLVTERAAIDDQLTAFGKSLPDGVQLTVDLQTLTATASTEACTTLRSAMRLDDLLFDRNSSEIRGADVPVLNQIADFLRRCPEFRLRATGHSDGIGSDRDSRTVSRRRADSVTDYLQSLGVPGERLLSVGKGKSSPVASNATWEGRNLNRRVDLELYSVSPSSAGP